MSGESKINIIIALIAAVLAVATPIGLGLVVYFDRRRRLTELYKESTILDNLGVHSVRRRFQSRLARALSQFLNIPLGSDQVEKQLGLLKTAASFRSGIPPMKWSGKISDGLCPDQRMLYHFAVFYSDYTDNSTLLEQFSQQVYYPILQFWEFWASNLSVRDFRCLKPEFQREFILLSWLELAKSYKQKGKPSPGAIAMNTEILQFLSKLSCRYKSPSVPPGSVRSLLRHALHNLRDLW